jgi:hypothetical protein
VIGRAAAAVVALAVAAGLTAVGPAGACACGIALEAEVTGERALVIDQPGYEQIVLSLDLTSEGPERAAVVVPVPSDPEVEAIAQGDPLAYLDAATAPEPEPSSGDEGAVGPGAPVDVLGRDTAGGYDVTRLAADDPRELQRWLNRNGYELPAGAEPILADYVDAGWRYVAIRLAPDSAGTLRPLRVGFATDEAIYVTRMQVDAADPASFDEDLVLDDVAPGVGDPEGLSGLTNGIQASPNAEGAEDDGDELSVVAIALILATAASVLAAAIAYRAHRDD